MSTTTDVRKLLRKKNQERRITGEYVKYDTYGRLVCSLCNAKLPVGEDQVTWKTHIRSLRHQAAILAQPTYDESESDESEEEGSEIGSTRRSKPTEEQAKKRKSTDHDQSEHKRVRIVNAENGATDSNSKGVKLDKVEDADWEAFSKEVIEPTKQSILESQIFENATLSADPQPSTKDNEPEKNDDVEADLQPLSIDDEEAFLRDRHDMAEREMENAIDKFEILRKKMETLRQMREQRKKT